MCHSTQTDKEVGVSTQPRPITSISCVDAHYQDPRGPDQPRDGDEEARAIFPTAGQSFAGIRLQLGAPIHDHHEQRWPALCLVGLGGVPENEAPPRRGADSHARGIRGQLLELFHQGAGRDVEPLGHASLQVGWRPHCLCQHHVFPRDLSVDRLRLVDWVEGRGLAENERCHDDSNVRPTAMAKVGLSK